MGARSFTLASLPGSHQEKIGFKRAEHASISIATGAAERRNL